ncbi:MAG TPA: hypothetical protein VG722_01015 [Tepidisphaeraceae bacterium]|nr:hypothetical protein [Tepidisphaeraceae bacterium]
MPARADFVKRFDVVTMDCTPDGSDPHMCTDQLDALNFVITNGHMIVMPTDNYRSTINGNGNFLGCYYNNLSGLYGTYDGNGAADQIENYIVANTENTGTKCTWVAVNEISGSLWPSNSTYRAWLRTCMARLHGYYGQKVILFAPFTNPQNNASDWVPLSGNAFIAIECYLSGAAVNGSGNQVSWCQTQYQNAKNAYLNLGISASQLYLAEHFGQTVSGTAWGRSGVSYAGWDNAIKARSQGAHNVGFAGFIGYAWDKNGMGETEANMIHFEQTYASQTLP